MQKSHDNPVPIQEVRNERNIALIKSANTLEDLKRIVQEHGITITGKHEVYDTAALLTVIDNILSFKALLNDATRGDGFREKLRELLMSDPSLK
ncbi:MAG: hypothetical protein WCT11_03695 [Candidatus Magasanikbacteria bacterium]|jgi:hypothetical protein